MKTAILVALSAALAVAPTMAAAQSTTDKLERKAEGAVSTTASASKDGWITSKAKIALYADDRVSATAINVDTKGGVVTLRGKVASADEKKAAEEIAKGIEGVSSVKNNLQVVTPSQRKAVDRQDDEIVKAVKDRIKTDQALKGSDIDVRADKGTVTLTGSAKDLNARARASELARGVAGVKSVKNEVQDKG
jgi:hyperosmotically inducible periplasmic protein